MGSRSAGRHNHPPAAVRAADSGLHLPLLWRITFSSQELSCPQTLVSDFWTRAYTRPQGGASSVVPFMPWSPPWGQAPGSLCRDYIPAGFCLLPCPASPRPFHFPSKLPEQEPVPQAILLGSLPSKRCLSCLHFLPAQYCYSSDTLGSWGRCEVSHPSWEIDISLEPEKVCLSL